MKKLFESDGLNCGQFGEHKLAFPKPADRLGLWSNVSVFRCLRKAPKSPSRINKPRHYTAPHSTRLKP